MRTESAHPLVLLARRLRLPLRCHHVMVDTTNGRVFIRADAARRWGIPGDAARVEVRVEGRVAVFRFGGGGCRLAHPSMPSGHACRSLVFYSRPLARAAVRLGLRRFRFCWPPRTVSGGLEVRLALEEVKDVKTFLMKNV